MILPLFVGALTPTGHVKTDPISLVLNAGPVVQLVMLVLLIFSIISWGIIFFKFNSLKKASVTNKKFLELFWAGQNFDDIYEKAEKETASPVAQVFRSGFKELKKLMTSGALDSPGLDNIGRALRKSHLNEVDQLETYVPILATIGSASPFIGLFGTVWGIMNSFQSIGATGSANLAVVAPGISEALIATALGLFAAIPAVMAYNYFVNRINRIGIEIDSFSSDFVNIVKRNTMKS